jgi:CBS domain-containing protein
MPLTVRDVMDPEPVSVLPDTPVKEVVQALREHELSGLPVVTAGGRCIGIITESDLVMAGNEGDLHVPHSIQLFGGIVFLESLHKFEDRLQRALAAKAEEMMSTALVTIEPGASLQHAGRVMSRSRHNRLPVIEHGRLVGMVTRADVLDGLTRAG